VRSNSSRKRRLAACLGALVGSACASVPPPPRFSPVSPAEVSAPESSVAPARPLLTGAGELADPESPEPNP
jgi:hypothetical protein